MNPIVVQPHYIEQDPHHSPGPPRRLASLGHGRTLDQTHDVLNERQPEELEDGRTCICAHRSTSRKGGQGLEVGNVLGRELVFDGALHQEVLHKDHREKDRARRTTTESAAPVHFGKLTRYRTLGRAGASGRKGYRATRVFALTTTADSSSSSPPRTGIASTSSSSYAVPAPSETSRRTKSTRGIRYATPCTAIKLSAWSGVKDFLVVMLAMAGSLYGMPKTSKLSTYEGTFTAFFARGVMPRFRMTVSLMLDP